MDIRHALYNKDGDTTIHTYPSTIISLIIDKNILVLEHVLPTEGWEWEERLDKQIVKTLVINMLRNDGHCIIVMTMSLLMLARRLRYYERRKFLIISTVIT